MDYWSVDVMEVLQTTLLHYSITPSSHQHGSGHRQELLPNPQLQKLREENLGDKNLVRGKLAGRDCLVVLDPLGLVNQNCRRFVRDRVVLRPLCQDFAGGILEIDFDALSRRKIECDGASRQICQ